MKEIIYRYDGTFEGFLSCVFDSYVNKEYPTAFQDEAHIETTFSPPGGWRRTSATPSASW